MKILIWYFDILDRQDNFIAFSVLWFFALIILPISIIYELLTNN